LIGDHGINPDRILAQGVGYLAPIAPNTTDENRDKNRRVEAILDQD
jgi:OOP family OmpA-OmpF porin